MTDIKAIIMNSDDEEESSTIETQLTYENPMNADSDDNDSDSQTDTQADTLQTGTSKKLYTLPHNIFERMIQENCKDMIPIRYHKKYTELWNIFCLYPTYRLACNNIRNAIDTFLELSNAKEKYIYIYMSMYSGQEFDTDGNVRKDTYNHVTLSSLHTNTRVSAMVVLWLLCRSPWNSTNMHVGIWEINKDKRRSPTKGLSFSRDGQLLRSTMDMLTAGLKDVPYTLQRKIYECCISQLSVNVDAFRKVHDILELWWCKEQDLFARFNRRLHNARSLTTRSELANMTKHRKKVVNYGVALSTCYTNFVSTNPLCG